MITDDCVYLPPEYYFVSHKEFEDSIESGEFIEFTKFSNNYYGTRYSLDHVFQTTPHL